jgi:hypothetical protein
MKLLEDLKHREKKPPTPLPRPHSLSVALEQRVVDLTNCAIGGQSSKVEILRHDLGSAVGKLGKRSVL